MTATAPFISPTPGKFLRLPEVEKLVGWRRSQIYKAISEGKFPRQIRLAAKSVAWSEAELQAWMAARLAERDAATAKR
jgi:prophage regulatory protein